MTEEQVVLVNENDEEIGLMPKMEAHEKAVLHRAFSVFVTNNQGNCCCNNVQRINTILQCCGPIPVVATRGKMNPI